VVDVTIEATTRDTVPYSPLYFIATDANSYRYSAALLCPDDALKHGDLPAGEQVRGAIAFDIPETAAGLVLSYQPAGIFSRDRAIRIALD